MSDNILQPIFDLVWESGLAVTKLVARKWGEPKEEVFNFEEYFKEVKFCHEEQTPKLLYTSHNELGTLYTFNTPIGYGKDSISKFQSGLESALGYDIQLEFSGKYWSIQTLESKLPNKVYYEIPKRDKELVIPIGKSLHGTVSINLKENPNSFIVGTTGSGKSVCIKQILTSLVNMYTPEELELYLVDMKRVELSLFARCKHTKEFCYRLEHVLTLIQSILDECNNRYDIFLENDVTNIYQYNKRAKDKLPYKVLVIEEIVLLLQDKYNIAMTTLKQILAICRACGIFVILTTQRPSVDVLDPVVKANINNRIVFKCEDSKNSIIALDSEGAELLGDKDGVGRGHGILKIGAVKTEFRGYFITDTEVKEYTKKYLEDKPKDIQKDIIDLSFLNNL